MVPSSPFPPIFPLWPLPLSIFDVVAYGYIIADTDINILQLKEFKISDIHFLCKHTYDMNKYFGKDSWNWVIKEFWLICVLLMNI